MQFSKEQGSFNVVRCRIVCMRQFSNYSVINQDQVMMNCWETDQPSLAHVYLFSLFHHFHLVIYVPASLALDQSPKSLMRSPPSVPLLTAREVLSCILLHPGDDCFSFRSGLQLYFLRGDLSDPPNEICLYFASPLFPIIFLHSPYLS